MRKHTLLQRYVFLLVIVGGLFATGCNPTNKLAKSPILADQDSAAFQYYRKEKFQSAAYMFEQLMPAYRGTPRFETMLYYYSKSMMNDGLLIIAAEYFQNLVNQFPNSQYAEESLYNVGYCSYLGSLVYNRDQTATRKAIESFQLFLGVYPRTDKREEVNRMIIELRERLAHKAYNEAFTYWKIGQFEAATVACRVAAQDYPDSDWREKTLLLHLQAQVDYAQKSIVDKQEARYLTALDLYNRFLTRYPNSEYIRDAENNYERARKALERLSTGASTANTTSN